MTVEPMKPKKLENVNIDYNKLTISKPTLAAFMISSAFALIPVPGFSDFDFLVLVGTSNCSISYGVGAATKGAGFDIRFGGIWTPGIPDETAGLYNFGALEITVSFFSSWICVKVERNGGGSGGGGMLANFEGNCIVFEICVGTKRNELDDWWEVFEISASNLNKNTKFFSQFSNY